MSITSMRIHDNNKSIDFTEKLEANDIVRVSFWTDNPGSYGSIDLEEKHLLSLRKHITAQIRKIRESTKIKSKKQTANQ